MFGYVVINEPELRMREIDLYRSYYCGLCEDLRDEYGRFGQLTLNYDTTFLGFLLSCLYEPQDEKLTQSSCVVHPIKKRPKRRSEYTQYAADLTILLSWYSMRDNWEDEQQIRGLAMSGILHGAFKKAKAKYPEKAQVITDCLDRLHALEKRNDGDPAGTASPAKAAPAAASSVAAPSGKETANAGRSGSAQTAPREVTPDEAGACFGDLMAELFAYKHDMWEQPLRRMGFYLGKFVYLLDAYDDLEDDAESGSFNPLLPVRTRMQQSGSDFDAYVRTLLTMLMANCTRAFEALPIVENIDILRNILYGGVWTKFEEIYAQRTGAGVDSGSGTEDAGEDKSSGNAAADTGENMSSGSAAADTGENMSSGSAAADTGENMSSGSAAADTGENSSIAAQAGSANTPSDYPKS